MDMDNTHVICKDEISLQNYCLYCYKRYETSCSGENNSHNLARNFFKVIQKFDKTGKINLTNSGSKLIESRPSYLKDFVADAVHSVCIDCEIVIGKYVALNNELECIQLKMRWQIMQLHGIMRASRKVPSRVKGYEGNIRRKYHFSNNDNKGNDMGMVDGARLTIKEFRGKIFKTCSTILKVKRPLVRLQRLRNDDAAIPTDAKSVSDASEPFEEIILEEFKSEEKIPMSYSPAHDDNSKKNAEFSVEELKLEDGNQSDEDHVGINGICHTASTLKLKLNDNHLLNVKKEHLEYDFREQDCNAVDDLNVDVTVAPGEDEARNIPETKQNDNSAGQTYRKALVRRKSLLGKKTRVRSHSSSIRVGRKTAKKVDNYCVDEKKASFSFSSSSSSQKSQMGKTDESSDSRTTSNKNGSSGRKKSLKCTFKTCSARCSSEARLEEHLLKHGDFRCNFCEFSVGEVQNLVIHELNTHSVFSEDRIKVKCSRCSQKFIGFTLDLDADMSILTKATSAMIGHYMTKHLGIDANIYKCSLCGRKYRHHVTSRRKLRIHMKVCHDLEGKDEKSIFRCEKCNAAFLTEFQRQMHVWKDHGLRYSCARCNLNFENRHKFRTHMLEHKKEGIFKCEVTGCGETFLSQNSLNFHRVAHRGNTKLLKCPKDGCDRTFLNENALGWHLQGLHSDNQRTKMQFCDQCGKEFEMGRLKRHMQTHLHEGPSSWQFSCEICGKMCQNAFKLDEHMRTHTKVKPFACEYCGRSFSIHYNLKRHIELVHKVPAILKRKKQNSSPDGSVEDVSSQ